MVDEAVDLAIVGAGIAGTWLAAEMAEARPQWSIVLLERTDRIGGRLRSMRVPGLGYPIELGGMRYLSSHTLVRRVVEASAIPNRPFDVHGGPERSYLRSVFGNGAADPNAAAGYALGEGERGRSPLQLLGDTFEAIAPGAASLALDDWRDRRARSTFLGRPLTDWSLGEAGRAVRSAEGWAAAVDAFGYDSGINLQNAGTAIPYLTGAGNPSGEARVPLEGMDRIPGVLAERFASAGGTIRRSAEASRLEPTAEGVRIRLGGGDAVDASRVVLALPIPSLTRLASASPVLDQPAHRRLYASVAGYPAMKLYLWFERPWWRVPGEAIINRLTTDLPIRKVSYLDEGPDRPAAMLAMFTDARLTLPWVELAGGTSNGEPVPKEMLAEVMGELREAHPLARIPEPAGSALMHWGADPAEVGWHFWLAGANADEMMALAIQPDPGVPIHICGEVFSLEQAWAEGALQSALSVKDRLIG